MMKKFYQEPEMIVRNYYFNQSDSVFTVSKPELGGSGDENGLDKDDINNGDDIFGDN